jgi:hypothetical protein
VALCAPSASGAEKKAVPTYTNEDLDRVRPYRDQIGGASKPAVRPGGAEARAKPAASGRSEEKWRQEAARVRTRVAALQEQARKLREQIDRAKEKRGSASGRSGQRARWEVEDAREKRVREIEAQARDVQAELEDRARREGALPGWLR